jgi:hypothetical protein
MWSASLPQKAQVAPAFLASEVCELEPRSESLTRSFLRSCKGGKEEEGRGSN